MDGHKLFVDKPTRRLFEAGQIMADKKTPKTFDFGKDAK
jgi:hypothetical protein